MNSNKNNRYYQKAGEVFYENKDRIEVISIYYKTQDNKVKLIKKFEFDVKDIELLKNPQDMLKVYLKRLEKDMDLEEGEYSMDIEYKFGTIEASGTIEQIGIRPIYYDYTSYK